MSDALRALVAAAAADPSVFQALMEQPEQVTSMLGEAERSALLDGDTAALHLALADGSCAAANSRLAGHVLSPTQLGSAAMQWPWGWGAGLPWFWDPHR